MFLLDRMPGLSYHAFSYMPICGLEYLVGWERVNTDLQLLGIQLAGAELLVKALQLCSGVPRARLTLRSFLPGRLGFCQLLLDIRLALLDRLIGPLNLHMGPDICMYGCDT
jgi:hypothetical protein